MFHYVRDSEFLAGSYPYCAHLVNQLVQHLRRYEVHARMVTMGNRKRGLIVQNDTDPVVFEFYLQVTNVEAFRPYDLKEQIMNAFNEILDRNWLPNCQDVPAGIATRKMHLSQDNDIPFRIFITILSIDADNTWHRLLHFKTERILWDEWYWCPVLSSDYMKEMEYYLKPRYSLRIRKAYLEQRDSCLERSGYPCASLIGYVNALSQVYAYAQEKEKNKEQNTLL